MVGALLNQFPQEDGRAEHAVSMASASIGISTVSQ
jgi:hypothetical protein